MKSPMFLCTGVEHLLRDVKDATISTLATEVRNTYVLSIGALVVLSAFSLDLALTFDKYMVQVGGKLVALKGLEARLKEIHAYLELVVEGKLPLNHEILYHLQVSFPSL